MAGTGVANFLPFEALGDRNKPRGHSSASNVMQPWYTQGASYGHMSADLTLPSLQLTARMRADNQSEIAFTLPALQMRMYTGATVRMTLPALKLTAAMTIPNLMRISMALPSLQATADMLVGGKAEILATLPMLQLYMRMGWRGAFNLPSLQMSMHMLPVDHAAITMRLPALQLVAHMTRFSEVMSINITLPALQGAVRRMEVSMVLPALQARMHMQQSVLAASAMQTWAWNVRRNAMTRWTNYAFRDFVRFNNKYYGVGYDGVLYLLDGDTDAGAPIPWAWETGFENFDSPAQKGVMAMYIQGRLERGAELTLRTDKNIVYTYRTYTDDRIGRSDYRTYRVITGKGIRSGRFAIGMQSSVGGYMGINRVAPTMVVSKRNI
jgi:hypothetical protein